ncbi:hypothetical protein [Streptomyces sp. SID1034]|uniref:hypothetical protein n=1 Tax=Streptomyces sp. SID1034 TaxID=2690248 RepID=UPI001F2B1F64|nr:hypothetical protein [Streptomyces sp. SID1034]
MRRNSRSAVLRTPAASHTTAIRKATHVAIRGPMPSAPAGDQASSQATTRASQQDGRTSARATARRERSAVAQAVVHPGVRIMPSAPLGLHPAWAPDPGAGSRTGLPGRLDCFDRPRRSAGIIRPSHPNE